MRKIRNLVLPVFAVAASALVTITNTFSDPTPAAEIVARPAFTG